MKLIEKFKSLMPHVTVLASEDIKSLRKAVQIGDFILVDNILSHKKFRVIPLPVDDIFHDAFAGGHLDIINYLLSSNNSKEFHNVNLNSSFKSGCMSGNRDFVDSILNSEKIRRNLQLQNIENFALGAATFSLNMDVINFLTSSPKYKGKLDIHTNDDLLFKNMFKHGTKETIEYLIFDLKIPLTNSIHTFLNSNNYNPNLNKLSNMYRKMFETRDLKTELESAPNANLTVAKKRLKV